MNAKPPINGSTEHQEVSGLLPWYLNGTLKNADREHVDAHLHACAQCREDLALETQIQAELSSDTAVAYMPTASLKRLNTQLDALPCAGKSSAAVHGAPHARFWFAQRNSMVASIAVLGVALGLLAAEVWHKSQTHAVYYTVTAPAVSDPNTVIRAVFSPQMSVRELEEILDEAQLYIVGGPSEAGVYSLASTSDRNPSEAVAMLRTHPTVQFAELTRLASRPLRSP